MLLQSFYPRSPCGERLAVSAIPELIPLFLSTLSLRRATSSFQRAINVKRVSIHALLAESDNHSLNLPSRPIGFYPRSPCGERQRSQDKRGQIQAFLSTLSLRRATLEPGADTPIILRFYPRSPCGERRGCFARCRFWACFYPRSPCGERPETAKTSIGDIEFLSTLSLRRATD